MSTTSLVIPSYPPPTPSCGRTNFFFGTQAHEQPTSKQAKMKSTLFFSAVIGTFALVVHGVGGMAVPVDGKLPSPHTMAMAIPFLWAVQHSRVTH